MNPGKVYGANDNNTFRPHSKRDLAELLGVSVHILEIMIEEVKDELGHPYGGIYCVNQVSYMAKKFGQASVKIRPLSKKELADKLGGSVHIVKKMLEEVHDQLGEPYGGLYCVNQVLFMINKYGSVQ